jgi:hypothetical protein
VVLSPNSRKRCVHETLRPSRLVIVVSPDSVGVCRGGTAPVGTDARVGAGFRFGWLPAGWKMASGAVPVESAEAGPGGQVVNGEPTIVASYEIDPTPLSAVAGFNGTIHGHPAIVYLPAAALNQDQSVTWEPVPGVVATVSANNIRLSQTDLLRLADTLKFIPGVTPPAVGDLGHLIPRAQAIAAARYQFYDPNQPDVMASETWLVTG